VGSAGVDIAAFEGLFRELTQRVFKVCFAVSRQRTLSSLILDADVA